MAHAVLSRLGWPDAEFDQLFTAAITSSAADGRERVAHRQLELEWLARIWSPPPARIYASRGLVGRSVLGKPLDALAAHRDDVYAFTHAIMFHTDLGARRTRLPRAAKTITADAEAALAWCLDNDDYDLAGEVLLTWPMLARRWSAAAAFAFSLLAQVEDEFGFLPALRNAASGHGRLVSSYHTAYVMGLLCAGGLRPGCAPPSRLRAARYDRGVADAFGELGDSEGGERRWWRSFTDLAPRQQDALAPMLVAIASRRAVARQDVGALHRVLRRAASYDLLEGPVPRQVSEFLVRAQALGGLLAGRGSACRTAIAGAGTPSAHASRPRESTRASYRDRAARSRTPDSGFATRRSAAVRSECA